MAHSGSGPSPATEEIRGPGLFSSFPPLDLARCTQRFRQLTEIATHQVWTADDSGRFVSFNYECARFLGFAQGAACPENGWLDFLHPDDAAAAREAWKKSVVSGLPFEMEFRLRGREGYRWFLGRAQPLRLSVDSVDRWFATNTDIDTLKRRQEVARHESEAKDVFLAVLSHELRTPLTPVAVTATMLAEDQRLPLDAREQLVMMQRHLEQTRRLIDDLFDLCSIAHGRIQLRKEYCDLHVLLDRALETVHQSAATKRCVIERDYGARQHAAQADPMRLEQVTWNLLSNAIKFSPPQGRIRVATRDLPGTTEAPQGRVQIEISDAGIGLAPEMLEKIFLPFEQARAKAPRRENGMGLGLAIARAIMTIHGGSIVARSEGLQRGSTFSLELPAADSLAASVTAVEDPPAEFRRRRILLVEDHAPTLKALGALLQRDGHEVTTAAGVAEALQAAEGGTFDLLISDLGLVDGSGNELMAKLRATRGLPGIALTGYGMDADVAESKMAGFSAHLTKPVQLASLRRLIATIL